MLRVDTEAPDEAALDAAVAVLQAGGLLVYPTETLYALGARALDPAAVDRVRASKGRPDGKPLPLIAGSLAQARALCASWPAAADVLAARFWPGPLTLVLASAPKVPEAVTAGTGTVAVRVSGSALARRLGEAAGPLVSTSANPAGAPPATTCAEALQAVAGVALALDGGTRAGAPSTIVDLTAPVPRLVRAGAIAWADVARVLG